MANATNMTIENAAFHGGAFWSEVGSDFSDLKRMDSIVPADVLDAWFPPAPNVLQALKENVELITRCSPPAHADGLVKEISAARGIDSKNIAVGPGSSALIFLALRHWLSAKNRILILDPMYGEYAHILRGVIGCQFDTFPLLREEGYKVDLRALVRRSRNYDWIFLVNPNSPTGQMIDSEKLAEAISELPDITHMWIDEAYIEYAEGAESLEKLAASHPRVVVCKSLSKAYSLSGLRAAYIVCAERRAAALRKITPPWSVSLPAQIGAVEALRAPDYYAKQYAATRENRTALVANLKGIGLDVLEGVANSVLVHLDRPVDKVLESAKNEGVYLRDVRSMFQGEDPQAIRIAVRTPKENERVVKAIQNALQG